LRERGWTVHEHPVREAGEALAAIPDGAVVLIDGMLAAPAADVLVPAAARLRLVVLVHMPFGGREREVLAAAAAVVTTSDWARRRLEAEYGVVAHVAEPGVDAAEIARGSAAGDRLLCVAALTPGKGHDVLLDALAAVEDLGWECTCAGSLVRDPACADAIRRRAPERVRFPGPLIGADLEAAYAAADLLVLPSLAESYGMVITESLARGVPVLASEVGGVTEALGHGDDGTRPGLLVPPGEAEALAAALRAWLADADLRERLRRVARERRATLRSWADTTSDLAAVLADVMSAEPVA
jgi:glycosyltransferase involved in cell wall biosynthesis